jgi:aquaporin Z
MRLGLILQIITLIGIAIPSQIPPVAYLMVLQGFAGIAIGLALTLIHLVSIPVTNTSVNPARSISQALFVGDWALAQLWLFIVLPIAGAACAGLVYRYFKQR